MTLLKKVKGISEILFILNGPGPPTWPASPIARNLLLHDPTRQPRARLLPQSPLRSRMYRRALAESHNHTPRQVALLPHWPLTSPLHAPCRTHCLRPLCHSWSGLARSTTPMPRRLVVPRIPSQPAVAKRAGPLGRNNPSVAEFKLNSFLFSVSVLNQFKLSKFISNSFLVQNSWN
jgi:hypothetical protein